MDCLSVFFFFCGFFWSVLCKNVNFIQTLDLCIVAKVIYAERLQNKYREYKEILQSAFHMHY